MTERFTNRVLQGKNLVREKFRTSTYSFQGVFLPIWGLKKAVFASLFFYNKNLYIATGAHKIMSS